MINFKTGGSQVPKLRILFLIFVSWGLAARSAWMAIVNTNPKRFAPEIASALAQTDPNLMRSLLWFSVIPDITIAIVLIVWPVVYLGKNK